MLVVEGADLVGKTTLCKVLTVEMHRRGVPVHQCWFGKLPPSWDYYWGYVPHIQPLTIMDRFIMSEMAYGTVCRDGPKIGIETFRLLDARMRVQGSVVVCLIASHEVLRKRFLEKGDEHFSFQKIVAVDDWYRQQQLLPESLGYHVDEWYYVEADKPPAGENEKLITRVCDLWQSRIEVVALRNREKERSLWTLHG